MDKGFEQLLRKLNLNNIYLLEVSAKAIETKECEDFKLKVEWTYDQKVDDEKKILNIRPKCKMYFEPEGLCNLELVYSVIYTYKDKIAESEISKHIEELLVPCANLNSLLVGQITERIMGGSLIIVPPNVKLVEKTL
ncbi:MAG TPA: hypothetical protein GX525_12120 [Bacilli bacterium]|nr:hypothetical protein [Bacilli bacterium]